MKQHQMTHEVVVDDGEAAPHRDGRRLLHLADLHSHREAFDPGLPPDYLLDTCTFGGDLIRNGEKRAIKHVLLSDLDFRSPASDDNLRDQQVPVDIRVEERVGFFNGRRTCHLRNPSSFIHLPAIDRRTLANIGRPSRIVRLGGNEKQSCNDCHGQQPDQPKLRVHFNLASTSIVLGSARDGTA